VVNRGKYIWLWIVSRQLQRFEQSARSCQLLGGSRRNGLAAQVMGPKVSAPRKAISDMTSSVRYVICGLVRLNVGLLFLVGMGSKVARLRVARLGSE